VAACEAVARYVDWRGLSFSEPPRFEVRKRDVEEIIERTLASGRSDIGEMESRELIGAYGFEVPRGIVAHNGREAMAAARRIGYPVVMKIVSPHILHKSDIGGVRVGLRSDDEVLDAYIDMTTRARRLMPHAHIVGVFIQELVTGGKEVIIGATRDPQFGPMIMFGMGGVYVEVLKDVAFRIAPLSPEDADEMIREIRMFPILHGVRGEEPTDLAELRDALLRVSQLLIDFPQIAEMDINPLKVYPKGKRAVAIDARFTILGG